MLIQLLITTHLLPVSGLIDSDHPREHLLKKLLPSPWWFVNSFRNTKACKASKLHNSCVEQLIAGHLLACNIICTFILFTLNSAYSFLLNIPGHVNFFHLQFYLGMLYNFRICQLFKSKMVQGKNHSIYLSNYHYQCLSIYPSAYGYRP